MGATLADLRVHFFTGKGGVGKSTVVAAAARGAAKRGRRPLIVELGHRSSLQALFEGKRIGHAPSDLGDGVWGLSMDFEEALIDYAAEQLKVRRLAEKLMASGALRAFVGAAPAVAEVAALRMLQRLESEQQNGQHRWDPILVDLDATGHARMFLSLPKVFEGLAGDGPLRRVLQGATALLEAPGNSALHLVTLPSVLPAQETVELHGVLAQELAMPLGLLVINRMPSRPLTEAQLATLPSFGGDHFDLYFAHRLQDRWRRASRTAQMLRETLPMKTCVLEDRGSMPLGLEDLDALGLGFWEADL